MTADYNGWNDAPEAEREAMDLEAEREALAEVEGIQQSIIRAQLQIVKDLERRKQSDAGLQLLIDSVTPLAA